MFITDYKDKKYNQIFNTVYNDLLLKKQQEDYTIQDLENFLESLYASQGDNWVGRGDIKDLSTSATIAACETLLCKWLSE